MISICTPVYNRCNKIQKLYKTLCQQTDFDFEWIVVDDGSTDELQEVMNDIINLENPFVVQYKKQKNQGKHVALNTGVKMARGELFFIVDSDDWLPVDAIHKIKDMVGSLSNRNYYAGVAGLKVDQNDCIVGTKIESDYIDCTSLERNQYNIKGDKAEVFFTNILQKYPFPVFENENFLTESVVWYRVANDKYKIRWTNDVIYYCEYLEGGLSRTTGKCTKNFEGFKLTVREELKYDEISKKEKLKQIAACGGIGIEKRINIKKLSEEIGCSYVLMLSLGIVGFFIKSVRKVIK